MREKCDLTSFKEIKMGGTLELHSFHPPKQPEHPVSTTHRQFFLHSLTMSI
jgi:hypothetical protein